MVLKQACVSSWHKFARDVEVKKQLGEQSAAHVEKMIKWQRTIDDNAEKLSKRFFVLRQARDMQRCLLMWNMFMQMNNIEEETQAKFQEEFYKLEADVEVLIVHKDQAVQDLSDKNIERVKY